jgi:hypothetical protein
MSRRVVIFSPEYAIDFAAAMTTLPAIANAELMLAAANLKKFRRTRPFADLSKPMPPSRRGRAPTGKFGFPEFSLLMKRARTSVACRRIRH